MAETYTFKVVGTQYLKTQGLVDQWAQKVSGTWTPNFSGDDPEKAVLVHVPVLSVSGSIEYYDEDGVKQLVCSGETPIKDISLTPGFLYTFAGKNYSSTTLEALLQEYTSAVQLFLHLGGRRFAAGWVPHPIAVEIAGRLEQFYLKQIKADDGLLVTLHQIKRYA